jgi:hypothetical protein
VVFEELVHSIQFWLLALTNHAAYEVGKAVADGRLDTVIDIASGLSPATTTRP